jgi:hypothetical protein
MRLVVIESFIEMAEEYQFMFNWIQRQMIL